MPLRALPLGGTKLTGGFWSDRRRVNRETTIPAAAQRLEEVGTLANFRPEPGPFAGKLFADTDVYKWLEAVAWEQARSPSDQLLSWQVGTSALVAAAQEPDGYLNTYTRRALDGRRYGDLEKGHELYCAGHLFQAAVAQVRATGDRTLLDVACRFADHLCTTFGPGRLEGVDGHPLIEMALVELYRETASSSYLELASYFVEARGRGMLAVPGHHGPAYFQDHLPVRQVRTIAGHAVRALYLACGATDVAVETGDASLLDALRATWSTMVESQMYLTGGVGSRWYGEAFGDPFELPPDTAYCETCAAIASVQWSWRLLLVTGESKYADLIERTLYNAVISGVSLAGDRFFYVNTLKVRDGAFADDQRSAVGGRQPWFGTACCPPNVMRTLSSLDQLVATCDDDGVQLQLYAPASVRVGEIAFSVETNYPWDGTVRVRITSTPSGPWTLGLRIPSWADSHRLTINGASEPSRGGTSAGGTSAGGRPAGGGPAGGGPAGGAPGGGVSLRRVWAVGDDVVLELPIAARRTTPDERVDSVRGCVAIERGPLVYCFEQQDADVVLDRTAVVAGALVSRERPDLLGGVTTVEVPGRDGPLTAIPYYAWANREVGPMTVWIREDT
jgi:hypothetical protein